MGFVHLHLHTEYSLLDGACRVKELVKQVKAMGQTSVAITDHGVMYGAIEFYKAARAEGIKPIIGCEVYVARRGRHQKEAGLDGKSYHLILLAENLVGYQNLIYLVSKGFTEGFYSKPRIDRELLRGRTEGLICLSGCLAGEVPQALLYNDYSKAKEAAVFYKNLFGAGNYFLEIQDHGIPEQQQILPDMIKLSKEVGVELVATNDAHYLTADDSKMHNLLVCIQTGKTIYDEGKLEFPTQEFYVKSEDEMRQVFPSLPSAIENTVKIAERCNLEFTFGEIKLPTFTPPDNMTNSQYFRQLCFDGLARLYGETPEAEVTERLEYELEIIEKMGYVAYFLIVFDFINYAKSVGIPVGPGRGSGAGSIAAYCIGITGIDPIKFNLLFERFLNPERVSMPDFDIDFCYVRRQEVIDYVVRKYGADHVAQIATFGTMAARGATRDVGRALGLEYGVVDRVAKMIPSELGITIEKAVKTSDELAELSKNDQRVHELVTFAKKVEGMPRHVSTHAAGVVIAPQPVDEYVPLAHNDGSIVTQFPMTTLEELGLLKMDFLGLRTLTVISDASKMVQRHNSSFNIEGINLEDAKVFQMLGNGDVAGVFQFESEGMRRMLMQLKPEHLEDLTAAISLYRPGPMDSIPTYIKNRHNASEVRYSTPQLQEILKVTYGCIVYQEQVMEICRKLAGYSYGQADLVRRAMSKKKADVMEKEREHFINGCNKNGIECSISNKIFDDMSSFAAYAFNKSHAAAYSLVAYQTAFLKYYYPKEFMAALLTSVLGEEKKMIGYIYVCEKMSIPVLPPHINKSDSGFIVDGENVRFGLLGLKNLGYGVINKIVSQRSEGDYSNFGDFYSRLYGTELNKRGVESLIKSGAFDELGENRKTLLLGYPQLASKLQSESVWKNTGQLSLFGNTEVEPSINLPFEEEYDYVQKLAMEKEVTGIYISGHPMGKFDDQYKKYGGTQLFKLVDNEINQKYDNQTVHVLAMVVSKKVKVTKNNTTMAFIGIEDHTGGVEGIVFAKVYEAIKSTIVEGVPLKITGRLSVREDEEPKLLVSDVVPLSECTQVSSESTRKLYLRVASLNAVELAVIKSILQKYHGKDEVRIHALDTKKTSLAPKTMWVDINDRLTDDIINILGAENVKIVE